jgi:hypothetical protein
MAATHPSVPSTASADRRRRRWIGLCIATVVLLVYAAALTWTTRRLETDIQKSIHALPQAGATHHDAD